MNASVSARAAKHSSSSVELYTPVSIVDRARIAIGGAIDLDPASCEFANRVVRATEYFDESRDGLAQPWWGRVLLNPPGGALRVADRGTKSRQVRWWLKLCEEYEANRVASAVFVCFSLEMLQACQEVAAPHPIQFPCCVPKKRIRFDSRARDLYERLRNECEKLRASGKGPLDREVINLRVRMEYLHPFVDEDARVPGDQPTHGNLLVFLPERPIRFNNSEKFASAFRDVGYARP